MIVTLFPRLSTRTRHDEAMAAPAEEMRLAAPPRRVTRPDGAVLPFALELDRAVQPGRPRIS
jgi:pyruvate dehydrogenase E1 component beta subunit